LAALLFFSRLTHIYLVDIQWVIIFFSDFVPFWHD